MAFWFATGIWLIGLAYAAWRSIAYKKWFVALEDAIFLPIYNGFTLVWMIQGSSLETLLWQYWIPLFCIGWLVLLYQTKAVRRIYLFKETRRMLRHGQWTWFVEQTKEVFLPHQETPADVVIPTYGVLDIAEHLSQDIPTLEKILEENKALSSSKSWDKVFFIFTLVSAFSLLLNAWFYAPFFL